MRHPALCTLLLCCSPATGLAINYVVCSVSALVVAGLVRA